MGVRARVGQSLESTLGKDRTDKIRTAERRYRSALSTRLAPAPEPEPRRRRKPAPGSASPGQRAGRQAQKKVAARPLGEPNDRQGGWIPSDPFVPHPEPKLTRHDLLRGLHERLVPRTYLEIGVNEGASLTLSRSRTVAIDPEYAVRHPLHCDLDLVKAKSDAYFSRPDALSHFDGVPVDLAFIDGMHLSEFALRDFINVERHLATTGVTVFDDVLPRNPLEAARVRRTGAWAGDIYKSVEVVARHRSDLVVLLVNTWPTGTAVIIGADPASEVLEDGYASEVPYLEAEDPQAPPPEYMSRTAAVDPEALLASEAWPMLVSAREKGDADLFAEAVAVLRAIPTLGQSGGTTD